MASLKDRFMGMFRRSVGPMSTAGVGGTQVLGGYVITAEKDSSLIGSNRYAKYSEFLANISIVAAGVRYFLALVGKSKWKVEPAEDGGARGEEIAEIIESIMDDMTTPWHRVVRRAAMFKMYGFSCQEWTAKKRDDGAIGLLDIEPRPQKTIERWDIDETGTVHGCIQRSPQTGQELYLPRKKLLYLVDDSLNDSPEGLGLFRHLAEPAKRLKRYEQLEGFGFETDLRGMPIGRMPLQWLADRVAAGQLTEAQKAALEAPLKTFIENHIRNPQLGLLLDSETYKSLGEDSSPSPTKKWDLEITKADSQAHDPVNTAIMRVTRELARVLGVEHLLVGESGAGSLAMHKDKTAMFAMLVDGALLEIVESFESDLLPPLFELNGWDKKLFPTLKTEAVSQRDIAEVTGALRDLAQAGAMLSPDDPAIGEVRDIIGLSRPIVTLSPLDAAIPSLPEGGPGEEGDEEEGGDPSSAKKPEQSAEQQVKKYIVSRKNRRVKKARK